MNLPLERGSQVLAFAGDFCERTCAHSAVGGLLSQKVGVLPGGGVSDNGGLSEREMVAGYLATQHLTVYPISLHTSEAIPLIRRRYAHSRHRVKKNCGISGRIA